MPSDVTVDAMSTKQVAVEGGLWTGLWTDRCCVATSNSASCNTAVILYLT